MKKTVPVDGLLKSAKGCYELLTKHGVPHAVIGSIAVYLHGYERKIRGYRDVDVLVREMDRRRTEQLFLAEGFTKDKRDGYRDARGQSVGLCTNEDYANRPFPDPEDRSLFQEIEGVRVPTLKQLMTIKLKAVKYFAEHPTQNPRKRQRNEKHREDVRGLIVSKSLTEDFAEGLPDSLRDYYLKLLTEAGKSGDDQTLDGT